MKILTDLHTHTNVSAHAFSSLQENARYAASIGLELIAITNHGPYKDGRAEDGIHLWHFENLHLVPRNIDGITVLRGAEVNVLDEKGTLDIPDKILSKLDIVIASCHDFVFEPYDDESFKRFYTAIMRNPHIDIIGHICRNKHLHCLDEIIKLAKENNKLIEINIASSKLAKFTENVKLVIKNALNIKQKLL